MEKFQRKDYKNAKGITLIALVITIITLLILAGVSISAITGSQGIMSKAKQAKEATEKAEEYEKIQMATIQAMAVSTLGNINASDNSLATLKSGLEGVVENANSLSGNGPWAVRGLVGSEKETYTIMPDGKVVKGNYIELQSLSATDITLIEGETGQISVTKNPNNTTEGLIYSSSDTSKVMVDGNGQVTAVAAGSTTITITGSVTNTVSTTCTVTVSSAAVPLTDITLESSSASIIVGGTVQINATPAPENTTESLTYTSSNPNVASVTSTGLVTGVAASNDSVTITVAGSESTSVTGTFTVAVSNPAPTIATSTSHSVRNLTTAGLTWEKLSELSGIIADNEGSETNQINNDTKEVTVTQNGTNYVLGVGDTATVTYSGTAKTVRILGFNHDTLASDSSKKAGISLEFESVVMVYSAQMNSSDTNLGGWGSCALRTTLNGTYLENLKDDTNSIAMSTYIKPVTKTYNTGNKRTTNSTSTDSLWLLACSEIWNNGYNSSSSPYGYCKTKEGEQYKYYKDINVTYNSSNSNLVKNTDWWLRSAFFNDIYSFCFVKSDGSCVGRAANGTAGVAPGFSI